MDNMKFNYPAEKLSAARRILMAPHPKGEDRSFAGAFFECMLGLEHVVLDDLDDNARRWVRTIKQTIDTTGVEDPTGSREEGLMFYRARGLSEEEKTDFSNAVDELATYCHDRFYGVE